MDIKKLVPIDFSRKITPVVIGDRLYNSMTDMNYEIVTSGGAALPNIISPCDHLYVISYADRPNTGKQPVDIGDLLVDVEYYYNRKDFGNKTLTVDEVTWGGVTTYNSWKPSHDAMVDLYQAPLAKTGDYKPTSVDSELTRLVDFLYVNNLVITDENPVDCAIRELAEKHDIDMSSDEEKLRDALIIVINEECGISRSEDVCWLLLASDKFTITLNKE